MSENRLQNRLRCPICLALFRTPFDCCPADGTALVPAVGDPLIGIEIAGRHVIDERVGEGSMGLIYRAHHRHLPRSFAVKILFGDVVADARMRIRFAQEAALASRLNHPNVISVHDFGRSEHGLLYLVMDFIEGESLSALIAREAPMAPLRAIELTRQLAQGLGYAHDHGLVHRDFKPGNVMLERREDGPPVPRILDFGLAISVGEREDMPGRLTEFGYIVGTPIYMAPEQALDRPVDHRADLFALGVVLFEMLAGQPPFDGRPVEIAHKNVAEAPPRIAQRTPGVSVPPELEWVVRRLLQKNPRDRFDSAEELCAALDAVERSALEGQTQGMTVVSGNGFEGLPRAEIMAPDERGHLMDSAWHVRAFRPRRRLAMVGALVFAAGAIGYAVADRAGFIGVTRLKPPVVAEQAPAQPEPLAQPDAIGLSAFEPVEPAEPPETQEAAPPEPKAPPEPNGPSEARADLSPHRTLSHRARRRTAPTQALAIEDDATKDDPAAALQVQPDVPAEGESGMELPGSALAAGTAYPRAGGTTYKTDPYADLAHSGAGTAAGATPPATGTAAEATPPAADAGPPAPPPDGLSVDRLIRDYREIGEAIARLEAKQGEKVAQGFRERYFRIPYGDALRIPAVRRDTLAALAGLREEVMAAMQKASVDPALVPTG